MSPPTARTRIRLLIATVVIAAAGFAGGHALAPSNTAGETAIPAAPARFSPDDARPLIRMAVGSAALPALAAAPKAKATVVNPPPPPPVDTPPPPPPVGINPPPAPPPAAPPPPPAPNPDPQE